MAELDTILARYTHPDTGSLHGAAFVAVDRHGQDLYRGAFGRTKVDPESPSSKPLTLDTVTWIASQSKLTTSVAVLQAVEQGLIGLDDDVRTVVPALRDIQVLTGFDDNDQPLLEDLNGPLTLRQLISHTSGFAYDARHPLLVKYSQWAGRTSHMFDGTMDGQIHPLVFQPGTSWVYGSGLDWAGQVIEKLTGDTVDAFQQKHIWQPLGATNTTFFPAARGLTADDLLETGLRTPGQGTPHGLTPGPSPWKFACRDSFGGAGLYSTANDYIRLLAALVGGGAPLLSPASFDEMVRPQVSAASDAAMRAFITGDVGASKSKAWLWTAAPEEHWADYMEVRQCLCGLVNSEDVVGRQGERRRRQGTVNWDGLPNLLWFVDRESGVAATFFTQIMPMDDAEARKLCTELEEALYRLVEAKEKK